MSARRYRVSRAGPSRRIRYGLSGHPAPRSTALRRTLAILLLASGTAKASCPEPSEHGQALIEEGDIAWVEGRRAAATCAWRRAASSEDPAVRAMAELRRLRVSGNLGLAVHGPRADRALAACPGDEPWCRLAAADRALIVTELGLGDDGPRAAAYATSLVAEGRLVLPATIRAVLAGAAPLDALATQLASGAPDGDEPGGAPDGDEPGGAPDGDEPGGAPDGDDSDGDDSDGDDSDGDPDGGAHGDALPVDHRDEPGQALARALLHHGGPPPSVGTWTLGFGLVAAPGLGAGPVLRFTHPDLAWRGWRLQAQASVTSGGAAGLAVGLRTVPPSARGGWLTAGAAARRDLLPDYDAEGTPTSEDEVTELQLRAAPGVQRDALAAWLGPLLRTDRPAGADRWVAGHGLYGGVTAASGRRVRLRGRLDAESALLGSTHLQVRADLVLEHPAPLGARLAWRLVGAAAPLPTSPTWRMPAWGGGEVLRTAPLGRFRQPWMAAAVGEWRQPLTRTFGLALFGEIAATPGVHGGGGAGIRLALPPRPSELVRFDVGLGDEGLALTAGFGAAF